MVVTISYTIRRCQNSSNAFYRLQNLVSVRSKSSRFYTNISNVQRKEYFNTLSSLLMKRNLSCCFHHNHHHHHSIQQQPLQQQQQQQRLVQQLYQSSSCVVPNELLNCCSRKYRSSSHIYIFNRSFSTNSNNKHDETKITQQQEREQEQHDEQQTKHINIQSDLEPLPNKVIPLTDEIRQSDEYQKRHLGIIVHPNSINNYIVPRNHVLKRKSKKKDDPTLISQPIELAYGYFWMIKDLNRCNSKPILSNTILIPERNSLLFPSLPNVSSLGTVSTNNNISSNNYMNTTDTTTSTSTTTSGFWTSMFSSVFGSKSTSNTSPNSKSNTITLPDYFVRKNRSNDPYAHCTIVFISFRDFGYQQIKQWQEQIVQQMQINNDKNSSSINKNDRIELITLHISEGFIIKNFLQSIITTITRSNTKPTLYDTTFLYFTNGTSTDPIESFRDSLRLHNTLVGYILLVDGIGRVRYAASGVPSSSDISQLLQFVNELTPSSSSSIKNTDTSTTANHNIEKKKQQNQYHNNTKRRR